MWASAGLIGLVLLAGCGDGSGVTRTPTATAAAATATRAATATVAPPSPTASASVPTATAMRPTSTATATVTATVTATFSSTATASSTATPTRTAGAEGAVAPLTSAGRWFVDGLGRVVLLHGVNIVAKRPPYFPSVFGFDDDDVAFLAAEGFTTVRLGVDFRGLMPTPGIVETTYIDALAETVQLLVDHHLFVLLDFHQDGFSPMFNGNGLPDWMAISDGLPNPPDAVFPLYYIQNPAMQRAFENFWANHAGPNGVGLQDYYMQGVEAVTARFADQPYVIGTELMNEPFPGADWGPCVTEAAGCPGIEQQRLVPFQRRGAAAVHRAAPDKFVFVEPFVLFNFGQSQTSLPGTDPGLALSFHSYALSVGGEEAVIANGVAAATRDGAPVLLTEFGASTSPVLLNRLTAQMERALLPWMFWAYDESIVSDLAEPVGPDNLELAAVAALVRPYPIATTGTPLEIAFDPAGRTFRYVYDTAPPAGVHSADNAVTVVSVPGRHYPDGYAVQVEGAVVTSAANARLLTLRTSPDVARVTVQIAPVGSTLRAE